MCDLYKYRRSRDKTSSQQFHRGPTRGAHRNEIRRGKSFPPGGRLSASSTPRNTTGTRHRSKTPRPCIVQPVPSGLPDLGSRTPKAAFPLFIVQRHRRVEDGGVPSPSYPDATFAAAPGTTAEHEAPAPLDQNRLEPLQDCQQLRMLGRKSGQPFDRAVAPLIEAATRAHAATPLNHPTRRLCGASCRRGLGRVSCGAH